MASGAKIGKRTQFLRETTVGGGSYAAVAEVKSLGGPTRSRDAVEATNFDSANDAAEFIAGIVTEGQCAIVANFRPDHASQGASAGVAKDFAEGTVRGWQIQWP